VQFFLFLSLLAYMKYHLLACILFIAPAVMAQQKAKKNVLFIIVDDMKPFLGCYGDTNARTPNIDRLAARGRVFDRAYCQQAVCAPSRASFMTGKRPDQLKIWGLSQPFRPLFPDIVTLPQYFKNNGYTTAATGKIYHDPPAHHDPASWSWPALLGATGNGIGTKYALEENAGKSKAASIERAAVEDSGYIDGKVATTAIDLLNRLKDQPFFLAVGFRRPHLPFTAPDRYWQLFDGKPLPLPDTSRPKDAPPIAFHQSEELRGYTDIPDKGAIPTDKVKELLQGYYAAVSYTDAQIGKVLNELERLGLTNNTIVVLLSDHGFHLGEQGMWAKSTNFENATRVPLIISAPGVVQKPGHTAALTELVDLYPTLTALCGIGNPAAPAGVSVMPVLQQATAKGKTYALSQFIRPYGALSNESRITHMGYSLRTDQYRFTEWYDIKTHDLVATELYDHRADPNETKNLAGQQRYAAQEKQLHLELEKLIR
jgi:iduronate 2-sulfatase